MCFGSTSRLCDGPADIAFETGHTRRISECVCASLALMKQSWSQNPRDDELTNLRLNE